MPIDTNLANWNKENEPSEKRTPPHPQRRSVQQGAPARRSQTPAKCNALSPESSTPKPQLFQKSTLKRGVQEKEQQRWFKIQQVFSSKQHSHLDDKSEDEQELMDELLQLCSWWSEGSMDRYHLQSEEQEQQEAPLFQEFANYLSQLSEEAEPVHSKNRKETRKQEVLMPLPSSDFDLNASF